jgi:hypothetical protein
MCLSFKSLSAITTSKKSPSCRNQTGESFTLPSLRWVASTAGEGASKRLFMERRLGSVIVTTLVGCAERRHR